jgi:hypothetical protein
MKDILWSLLKLVCYVLFLYSQSVWPGSWSYVYTMIGCNYMFSPPNSSTDFVSDISSKIWSSYCSITWNWETNLGYQTVLTFVIKQSPTCFKLQGKVFFFSTQLTAEIQEKHTCKCTSLRKIVSDSKLSKWLHFPWVCSKSCNFLAL